MALKMLGMPLFTSPRSCKQPPPGKSYRVNVDFYLLVVRLNIIFERNTEHPKSLLLPSLLTSFKKRTYHQYKHRRSANIWATREELLEYVEALRLEAYLEHELEPPGRLATMTPVPGSNKSKFVTPDPRNRTTPLRTPNSLRLTESPLCKKGKEKDVGEGDEEAVEEVPIGVQKALNVKKIFDEKVFPRWKELVALKNESGFIERTPGLERFEPGVCMKKFIIADVDELSRLCVYPHIQQGHACYGNPSGL